MKPYSGWPVLRQASSAPFTSNARIWCGRLPAWASGTQSSGPNTSMKPSRR
jgi:hypothetical protein